MSMKCIICDYLNEKKSLHPKILNMPVKKNVPHWLSIQQMFKFHYFHLYGQQSAALLSV